MVFNLFRFFGYAELAPEIRRARRTRIFAAALSIAVHLLILSPVGFLIMRHEAAAESEAEKPAQSVVMLIPGLPLIHQGESQGGGGKRALVPASGGRLPRASSIRLVPPNPKPIEAKTDFFSEPMVITPVELPQNRAWPIGDLTQPPGPPSSGAGLGGGVGTGRGTGLGSGEGPGIGSGYGGGIRSGPRGDRASEEKPFGVVLVLDMSRSVEASQADKKPE